MTRQRARPAPDSLAVAVLLTMMVALGPVSTDLYLPSLPAIREALGTDEPNVQLTLSGFLVAFALCQLVHGPLSDRAGLEQFQRFLREVWAQVEPLAKAGRSLEETRAAVRLTEDEGYEAIVVPGIVSLDRDFVVRRAWEEATGTVRKQVETREAPPALALVR